MSEEKQRGPAQPAGPGGGWSTRTALGSCPCPQEVPETDGREGVWLLGCSHTEACSLSLRSSGPVGRARHFLQPLRPPGPGAGRTAGTRGTVQAPDVQDGAPTLDPNCSGSDKEQESFPNFLCLAPPSITGHTEGTQGEKTAVKVRNGENTETV